jgi:4-amino-4-deoxy-L-arabinose transferase-like glycosyltransferase
MLLLLAVCGFLFFYGLGAFGLLGADEPRYAQVAREMLDRRDWVTPTLEGKPWLEKPPLYYWQAMLAYELGRGLLWNNRGVDERTARLPGAVDAFLLVAAIYFFLRRLRPGTELDGALIASSCAGAIGFARAASTDMPLTATFGIALLGWYAWYEQKRRLDLAIFYFFLGLGMLAKGPVAPALAALILLVFAAAKHEWGVVWRTIWFPGVVLFLAVALPWYIAVEKRNPEFFRVFILQHNLARFSTNVYHHPQPFWFYVPVFLLGVMPWVTWLLASVTERAQSIWRERQEAIRSPEDSWVVFLLIWMIVPVIFFSASQSKLPGYILPAVPGAALLVTDYLRVRREESLRISLPLAVVHGVVCGVLVFAALSAAGVVVNHHVTPGGASYIAAAAGMLFTIGVAAALRTGGGARLVRSATLFVVVVCVAVVLRLAAPAIDATQSARPLAQTIEAFSHEPVPVALYHVSRVEEYGLEFYLNRSVERYGEGQAPAEAHLLVAAAGSETEWRAFLASRKVSYLTGMPAEKLDLYWVGK